MLDPEIRRDIEAILRVHTAWPDEPVCSGDALQFFATDVAALLAALDEAEAGLRLATPILADRIAGGRMVDTSRKQAEDAYRVARSILTPDTVVAARNER